VECSQVAKLLSDFADGALDEQTRRRVEGHLSLCESCSAELDALEDIIKGIGSMERVRAPRDFLDNVHARIELESLPRRIFRRLFHPLYIKVPMEVAGVIVALLLVVTIHHGMLPFTQKSYSPSVEQPPQPPAAPMRQQVESAPREEIKEQMPARSDKPAGRSFEEMKPVLISLLVRPPKANDEAVHGKTEGELSGSESATSLKERELRARSLSSSPRKAPASDLSSSRAGEDETGHLRSSRKEKSENAFAEREMRTVPEFSESQPKSKQQLRKVEPPEAKSTEDRRKAATETAPPPLPVPAPGSVAEPGTAVGSAPAAKTKPAPGTAAGLAPEPEPEPSQTPARIPYPASRIPHPLVADPAPSQEPAPARPPLDLSGALTKIQSCILRTGGTVLSVEYDKETNLPLSLSARIPGEKYNSFLESLRPIGEFAGPTPPSVVATSPDPIPIKIELKTEERP
jgi:anti-sigma factor RsiW